MSDPFIMSIAANYFSSLSYPIVKHAFQQVFKLKPNIEEEFKNAKTDVDFEKVFKEVVGLIDAHADDGSIEIDKSFLTALNGIRFDHQNGKVLISDSTLTAPVLQVGGANKGTGKTEITGSNLSGSSSRIKIGHNAGITISGGARIRLG